MKKTKRIVLLVLAVVVLLLAAYAGKTVLDLKNSAATEVQEEDSTRWAELTSDPLTLEGIADGSAASARGCASTSGAATTRRRRRGSPRPRSTG